jgi:hypothetical protein
MTLETLVRPGDVIGWVVRAPSQAAVHALRDRLRYRIREFLDLDGLEQYMAEADVRWHAMLDELGYPPLPALTSSAYGTSCCGRSRVA